MYTVPRLHSRNTFTSSNSSSRPSTSKTVANPTLIKQSTSINSSSARKSTKLYSQFKPPSAVDATGKGEQKANEPHSGQTRRKVPAIKESSDEDSDVEVVQKGNERVKSRANTSKKETRDSKYEDKHKIDVCRFVASEGGVVVDTFLFT